MASLLAPASLAVLLVGCHVDLSGLNQLFSSDPTYLSLPGQRIGGGKFSGASIVGTNVSGAHVIAFDSRAAPTVLTIFPIGGGKGCSTGPARGYQPLDFGVRSTVPAIVGYHEVSGSDTLLHLITLDCKEGLPPIKDKGFPLDVTFDDPPGYLAVDTTGNLTFMEPWNKKQTIIAEGVSGTRVVQNKLWSIESGALVVRDMKRSELARFGTNVTEFDIAQNSVVHVAYIDATCAADASPCEGDLYEVTDALDTPEKVDSNACDVVFPTRWGGLGVSYRSPCADRTSVVYGSTTMDDTPAEKITVGPSILGTPDVDFMGKTPYVFYARADDPKGTPTLYGGVLGQDLESIADNVTRDSNRGAPIVDKVGSSFRMTVEFDGTLHAGRLVTWSKGQPLTDVAANVAQINGSVAIVDFDGSTGNLVALQGATVSTPLAHAVPRQHVLIDDPGIALVANYDGDRGTGDLLVAPAGTTDFEKIAKGITLDEMSNGDVLFLQSFGGIGYLHDFDGNTGVFGARIIETGDSFDVGVRASEWVEAGWPEPGILYLSPEGDGAGIWFARLR